jgi:hypothetical protein
MAAVVLAIFSLGKYLDDSIGMPAIKASVTRQLSEIATQSTKLNSFAIGNISGSKWKGEAASVNGYLIYNADQNGDAKALYVYWHKDLTNCQITKIEAASKYGSEAYQVIWEKH